MSIRPSKGIPIKDLGPEYESKLAHKSRLLLEARMLLEIQPEEAAAKFAEAAGIEEWLDEKCRNNGLHELSLVHAFSAASCWAWAGDLYRAIMLCENLLKRTDLTDCLRQRISDYVDTLRKRRAEWLASLCKTTADVQAA